MRKRAVALFNAFCRIERRVALRMVPLLGLFSVDLLTKEMARSDLLLHEPLSIFPSLNFTLVYNQGMAFSLLGDGLVWQKNFLCSISWIAVAVLVFLICKDRTYSRFERLALVFIAAGALGNAWDRYHYGAVIDFIDFYYQSWHFPTFNVADIYINVGVILLVLNLMKDFFYENHTRKS